MDTTWRKELKAEFAKRGDDFSKMVTTLTDEELDRTFNDGVGGRSFDVNKDRGGQYFTAWGENWVYFPAYYDGEEWVASVPRNPCAYKTQHIGNG